MSDLSINGQRFHGAIGRMKNVQPALIEGFSNVARWLDEMSARPAIQRAMKF